MSFGRWIVTDMHCVDSSLAPFDGDLESLPALSRGPSLVSSPMVEKQPQELRYWIAPEHCKSPKQKEEDISAWFRGIDVMDIEQDSQSYPLA